MRPVNAVSLQDVRDICAAISEDNLMFSFSATSMKMVLEALDLAENAYKALMVTLHEITEEK